MRRNLDRLEREYANLLAALSFFADVDDASGELRLRVFRQGRELELVLQLAANARTPRALLDPPAARVGVRPREAVTLELS